MAENIRVSDLIPATPEAVFAAWLDGDKHTAFTGSPATAAGVGGSFTAWDGYIEGTTFEAEPHRRIVQSWRTSEFPAEAPPSRLEIILEAAPGGTVITLIHSEIPAGQGAQYESGWKTHYLEPMKRYFGNGAVPHAGSPTARAAPKRKPAAKKKKPAKRAASRGGAKRSTKKKGGARGKKKTARRVRRR